eukprot:3615338-Karenia_brevis.AAC.1
MVAIVQQLPSRKVAQGGQLVISRPKTCDHLEAKGHQVDEKGPRLGCHICGQESAKGTQEIGG